MRRFFSTVLYLLLAAVLVSLGGYFLTSRNAAPAAASSGGFQFVADEEPEEPEEIVYTYTDIEYTPDGVVPVATEVIGEICFGEDMLAIADHPEFRYRLMNDIDMSGIDWVPVPLTGSFDGQGFTIYNLTVNEVSSEGLSTLTSGRRQCGDTRFAGLFSVLDNAEVTNLNLVGANIKVEAEQSCYAGTIAGYSDNSVISNCTVDSRIDLFAFGSNNGAGGVLGYGSARISSCKVKTEIVYSDMHTPDYADGSVGGLLADGYADITSCTVNADIYATGNMYLYCGAMAGQFSKKDFNLDYDPEILSSSASGNINYALRSNRSRVYCGKTTGYLTGLRLNKLQDKDYVSKITTLTGFSGNLSPECENPEIVDTVVESGCKILGYTAHACKNCGYSYNDSYVIPHHTILEPVFLELPKPGEPGLCECYCDVCGKLMFTAAVETNEPPPSLSLSYAVLDMEYGKTAVIDARNAHSSDLVWTSENPEIASVDSSGRVSGLKLGTTSITCSDGDTTVNCRVNVTYSSEQSFIRKFLFGWAWMK